MGLVAALAARAGVRVASLFTHRPEEVLAVMAGFVWVAESLLYVLWAWLSSGGRQSGCGAGNGSLVGRDAVSADEKPLHGGRSVVRRGFGLCMLPGVWSGAGLADERGFSGAGGGECLVVGAGVAYWKKEKPENESMLTVTG